MIISTEAQPRIFRKKTTMSFNINSIFLLQADTITYEAMTRLALKVLVAMTHKNSRVQEMLFYNLNALLGVKYATRQLAELLKEVWVFSISQGFTLAVARTRPSNFG